MHGDPRPRRYADNDAIGYFKKQGFTMNITLPKRSTHGYIKDYDGGTQMQCVLHPGVDYLRLPQMIEHQKVVLMQAIQQRQTCNKTFPGLALFEQGHTSIPIEKIPGVREAGWRPEDSADSKQASGVKNEKNLQALLKQLYRDLRQDASSWPFLEPVSREEVRAARTIEPVHLCKCGVMMLHDARCSAHSSVLLCSIFSLVGVSGTRILLCHQTPYGFEADWISNP